MPMMGSSLETNEKFQGPQGCVLVAQSEQLDTLLMQSVSCFQEALLYPSTTSN